MDVLSVLQGHGIAGKSELSKYFGDGSDGAFDSADYCATATSSNTTAPNGGTVDNLYDNNNSTDFVTNAINSSSSIQPIFVIDFVSAKPISGIDITGIKTDANANSNIIHLQYSSDGAAWTTAGTSTLFVDTNYRNTSIDFTAITARYWRLATSYGGTRTYYIQGVSLKSTHTFVVPTIDQSTIIKRYTSVTIRKGHFITVDKRCRGLIIYSQGDVTIDGGINMDGKAALVDPTTVQPVMLALNVKDLYNIQGQNSNDFLIIGPGGAGGNGGDGGPALVNSLEAPVARGGRGAQGGWFGGSRGGGGAGGSAISDNANGGGSSIAAGGAGGDASFTSTHTGGLGAEAAPNQAVYGGGGAAGSGGGGAAALHYTISSSERANGSKGGSSVNGGGAGGGAGDNNPSTPSPTPGADGTGEGGGLVLIVTGGNLTINPGATITARGGNGGAGGSSQGGSGGGGGGGAGGGIVGLVYKGTYSNSGTINVNGGNGGAGGTGTSYGGDGRNGYAGSIGRIITKKVS